MNTPPPMPLRLLRLVLTAGMTGAAWTGPCLAHAPIVASLRQPARAGDEVSSFTARTAKDVANVALVDLQASGAPDAAGFRMAALLLEVAHEMAPADQDILRLLIDAWGEAGDRGKVLGYTKTLVELSPTDTVALLRLIAGNIASLQDVDARLAAYDRLLSPKYEGRLDDSIRSRLALDAALLLREKGDTDGFVSRVTLATTLDSTNKDAASLAATLFSMHSRDGAGRLTLLINLLKADPFDPETHLAIGRELAAGGASEQARRYFLLYQQLTTRLGIRPGPNEIAEYQTIAWNLDGAERLLSQTRLQVEQERNRIAAQRRELLTTDPTAANLPDPEEYRLAREVERVRAAAAAALGDDAQIDYVSRELENTIARRVAALQDPAKRPASVTDAQAAEEVKLLNAELMWMRLWIGRHLDGAAATLEEIEKDPSANAESLLRIQGWVRLRRGQLNGAAELLAPLAPRDPLAAIGLALITEKRGDATAAAAEYTTVFHDYPGTLAGAYARARAEALTGVKPAPAPQSQALTDLAAAVPDWLEGMIAEPRRVFSIMASPVPPRIGVLDPATVRLTILNLSPLPLGIGPDRPIQSSMLLAPTVSVGYQPLGVGNASTIARVDRRLRLLPQESLEVDAWADAGVLGYILDQVAIAPAELRWRVLQGFSIDENGLYTPGPMNVTCESGALRRASSSKNGLDPATLGTYIETGTPDDVIECMLVVRYKAQEPRDPADDVTAKADAKLAEAFAKRFPTLSPVARLSLLTATPTPYIAPWLAPLMQAARADADPRVRLFTLVSSVATPSDPFLATCAAGNDGRIAEVAGILKARLETGGETYGKLGAPAAAAPEAKPAAAPSNPNALPLPSTPQK